MRSMSSDLRYALDPAAWAKEVLREKVDPIQAGLLRRFAKAQRDALNCHRQWGKSTITSTRTAHRMKYHAPWFTVCIAPAGRQSAELLRTLESCARRLDITPKGDGDNEISMIWPNGSRFVGLPDTEGRMRGFASVNDLLIDEASRVRDETFKAANPFVAASDGNISVLSTPFGKRGFFHRICTEPGRWHVTTVTADQSGRFSAEFLSEQRESMGDAWFEQEYMCKFAETAESIFSADAVLDAINPSMEALRL